VQRFNIQGCKDYEETFTQMNTVAGKGGKEGKRERIK